MQVLVYNIVVWKPWRLQPLCHMFTHVDTYAACNREYICLFFFFFFCKLVNLTTIHVFVHVCNVALSVQCNFKCKVLIMRQRCYQVKVREAFILNIELLIKFIISFIKILIVMHSIIFKLFFSVLFCSSVFFNDRCSCLCHWHTWFWHCLQAWMCVFNFLGMWLDFIKCLWPIIKSYYPFMAMINFF